METLKNYLTQPKLLFTWSVLWRSLILALIISFVVGFILGFLVALAGGETPVFTSAVLGLASGFIAQNIALWHQIKKHIDLLNSEVQADAETE